MLVGLDRLAFGAGPVVLEKLGFGADQRGRASQKLVSEKGTKGLGTKGLVAVPRELRGEVYHSVRITAGFL